MHFISRAGRSSKSLDNTSTYSHHFPVSKCHPAAHSQYSSRNRPLPTARIETRPSQLCPVLFPSTLGFPPSAQCFTLPFPHVIICHRQPHSAFCLEFTRRGGPSAFS